MTILKIAQHRSADVQDALINRVTNVMGALVLLPGLLLGAATFVAQSV